MKTALKVVGALVVLGMIGSACEDNTDETAPVTTTSTELTTNTTVTSTKAVESTVTKTEAAAPTTEQADSVALSDIDSLPAGVAESDPVVQQQGFAALPQQQQVQSTSTFYKNCAAARAAGAAPIYSGQPGYGSHLDRDGDGVGCEK
ncbi:putative secreted protein [Corynebacterium aurimucosum ATCC 700975]|uniref:Excalibur calcium-binding domain-containing protein n=2 Tax=Corynebacterium TaxID=1716 RepID=A0A540R3W5_9CORY|nr:MULTISPECIES: excalibur calcium-binding domain-containing protein [Corynebacterium]ACP33371.1 putative secreted protein [Corynebacterium aurimucosum ATCC 700975]QQU92517.1 excalibur calcium-binding domain-containing protein [Corynebacterium aurimucosum]TQE42420.1 excalibur calcium-binding domain-containing protein [Corynebacterium phoceense]